MKYIIIVLMFALLALSACGSEKQAFDNETLTLNKTSEPEILNETQNETQLVVEEPAEVTIPTKQTFSVSLNEETTIEFNGTIYTFTISTASGVEATILYTTPDKTDSKKVKQGTEFDIYKDVSAYVSSLEIVQFPNQEVNARITLAEFDEDDTIHILEEDGVLEFDDLEVMYEVSRFQKASSQTIAKIELPALKLDTELTQGSVSTLGPFTIDVIAIDTNSKEVIAKVAYDKKKGLTHSITRDKSTILVNGEQYEVVLKNIFVDTTKTQPIQIEMSVNGRDYEIPFNTKTKLKTISVTVNEILTQEDADEDYIMIKAE